MISTEIPELNDVDLYDKYGVLTFSQYMDGTTLDSASLKIESANGTEITYSVEPLEGHDVNGTILAKSFKLIFAEELVGETCQLTITESLMNYAGKSMEKYVLSDVAIKDTDDENVPEDDNNEEEGTTAEQVPGTSVVPDDEITTDTKVSQIIASAKSSYSMVYKKNKKFNLNVSAKTSLSFLSSNEKVADVSDAGVVTIKGYGTAIILITAKESAEYRSF